MDEHGVEHKAAPERVWVYHGCISHARRISSHGLETGRLPVWVTRDIRAARNAIDSSLRADPVLDPGVIAATIPREDFDALLAPNERAYTGFNGTLSASSEIVLRTAAQVELFNKCIVKET